jgi:hypothetical protein
MELRQRPNRFRADRKRCYFASMRLLFFVLDMGQDQSTAIALEGMICVYLPSRHQNHFLAIFQENDFATYPNLGKLIIFFRKKELRRSHS